MKIRPIDAGDNRELARVIRNIMEEHKIDRPGTVYTDPTTDHLFELFQSPNSAYWVAEMNGNIVGGCGLYPTAGLPTNCVELVKLYLLKQTRGQGLGERLMRQSIDYAFGNGFKEVYLESMPELNSAIGLYEKLGFKRLNSSLGDSGHHACDVWMLLRKEDYPTSNDQ